MTEKTTRRGPGRPPAVPAIRAVVDAILNGGYDDELSKIDGALEQRRKFLKDQILQKVREVYGEDAEIIIPKAGDAQPPVGKPNPNPFFRFDRENVDMGQDSDSSEPNDEIPTDALSHLDDVEARLNTGEPPTIESRGAIIGGLSSSQIGD